MPNTPFWDKIFSTTSWGLVFLLLFQALTLWTIFPPGPGGPIASAGGILVAKTFYTALYGSQAMLLAYSKWKRRKVMRKHVLMFIYLTGFFTSILTLTLAGWDVRLIDNFVAAVVAAGCWLYWTFKTEYISYEQFERDIDGLREDSPPSRRFRFKG